MVYICNEANLGSYSYPSKRLRRQQVARSRLDLWRWSIRRLEC
jgi:hypothetical protein